MKAAVRRKRVSPKVIKPPAPAVFQPTTSPSLECDPPAPGPVTVPSNTLKHDTQEVVGPLAGQERRLSTHFKDGECDLVQIKRIGDFAVYRRTRAGRCHGYEIIQIRHLTARQTTLGYFEAREAYPTANAWGRDGVTIPDHDKVIERLAASAHLGAVASAARLANEKKGAI